MIGFVLALATAASTPQPTTGTAPAPAPIEVMVLGSYHLGNPGRDKVNIKVDDVTTPDRQRELAALAKAVAAFRPTRVMVEMQRQGPDYDVPAYRSFTPEALLSDPSEIVQIGYRIAARAGLTSVQGIDEQPDKGEPDYFPFGKIDAYVKDKSEQATLGAIMAPMQHAAADSEARMKTTSIPAMLIEYNDETTPMAGQGLYYRLLALGDGERQPGADLNAMWYLRNAKIFAKLINVVRPGDRVLVVYGAGHGYWLRHFAATTPGFVSVDVKPYLRRAAAEVRR